MTSASPGCVELGGSASVIKLPDITTVPSGTRYLLINTTTSTVLDVQQSNGTHQWYLAHWQSMVFISMGTYWDGIPNGQWSITDGKYGSITNTLTLSGTDGTTMTFPTTSQYVAPNPCTTTGDLPYASSTATPSAMSRLAAVAAGAVLVSAGTGTAPAWSATPGSSTALTSIKALQVAQTVQTVAVSTTPAINCASGNEVIIGTTGVVGALTAATTITFSNPVIGSTTRVRIKQGTTSFAITLTIAGYTFYSNGQAAGLASGGTPAALAAANMTLSCFYTLEILWANSTTAYVNLIKT
jgi:hypothetical protein